MPAISNHSWHLTEDQLVKYFEERLRGRKGWALTLDFRHGRTRSSTFCYDSSLDSVSLVEWLGPLAAEPVLLLSTEEFWSTVRDVLFPRGVDPVVLDLIDSVGRRSCGRVELVVRNRQLVRASYSPSGSEDGATP